MIRIYARTSITRHTLGAVSADSTGGGELNLLYGVDRRDKFHSGILRGLAVACDSTDFDVSVRVKSNGQADSIDEIYRVVNINKYRRDSDLLIGWVNMDPVKSGTLYCIVTNNDLSRGTGTIDVEIHTDINKKFSKS